MEALGLTIREDDNGPEAARSEGGNERRQRKRHGDGDRKDAAAEAAAGAAIAKSERTLEFMEISDGLEEQEEGGTTWSHTDHIIRVDCRRQLKTFFPSVTKGRS